MLNRSVRRLSRAVCLVALLCSAPGALFSDSGASIQYELKPAADRIGPDVDVAQLVLRVRTATGDPIPARLQVELDAPPRNMLVSTDFPIVEGTRLMRAEAATDASGEHALRYLFPIRGEYRLRVVATPLDPSIAPIRQEFAFSLRENPGEVFNLFLLMGVLFVFGGLAGIVFGRSAVADQAAQSNSGANS